MKFAPTQQAVRLLYHYTLGTVFCFSSALVLLVATSDGSNSPSTCQTTTTRIDCHPEPGSNELECRRRNCCWVADAGPNCFFPADFRCYQIEPIERGGPDGYASWRPQTRDAGAKKQPDGTTIGPDKSAAHNGPNESALQQVNVFRWMLIRSNKCPASGFADDATKLVLELAVYGESLINIKISEPDRQRFVPTLPEIKLPLKSNNNNDNFNRKNNDQANSKSQWQQSNSQASASGHNDRMKEDGKSESLNERLTIGHLFAVELQAASTISGHEDYEPQTAAGVLKVIHQISGTILFQADLGKLIYSRQFIQLPTYLPSSSLIYGLGQHMGDSLLKSADGSYAKSYTFFNYGHPPQPDGRTAYSSYPFYISLAQLNRKLEHNSNETQNNPRAGFEQKRKLIATGGLMLNSGPMDVLMHSTIGQETGLTWRLISGIVDLYLFLGPKPHDVVGQYQSLTGSPSVPPAWSLGYHQSRHNYMGLMQIKLAWAKARSAGIPVESVWTDIDFLWRGTSYTVNDRELNELVRVLQNEFDMHYVPIVDPAISIVEEFDTYEPLELAKRMKIFASHPNNSLAAVTTWTDSRKSALIDFTHMDVVHYLEQVLSDYKKKLNFDGLWLDMNEPEVFSNVADSNGQVCSADEPPPYLPGSRSLSDKTMCMAAKFELGSHLELHNLYAFYQSKAHYEALKILNPSRRPFILSRSQFVGQGKYSGAWLGDLASTFEHMQWSLLGMIESNWFGQPLIGADICGFFGSTNDELCARWFSLGAFYPFARNHNHGSARDQDPGSLGGSVQLAARLAMVRRYSLLPYLYTLFYDNHLKSLPVVRSVLFEFFDEFMMDTQLSNLPQIDDQFMWGSAIMFAPVLKSGEDSRSIYFPPGKWYDLSIGLPGTNIEEGLYDGLRSNWPLNEPPTEQRARERVKGLRRSFDCEPSAGCWFGDVFTPIGAINIYLKGGQIVPTLRHVNHEDSVGMNWRKAAFFLEAALDKDQRAFGSLFWDSGESEVGRGSNNQAIFWVQNNRLVISVIEDGYEEPMKFNGFVIYGLKLANSQAPQDQVYKDAKLVYQYKTDTESLSCVFETPSGDGQTHLSLERFERLEFKW